MEASKTGMGQLERSLLITTVGSYMRHTPGFGIEQ
jgi:hypothetical protein